MTTMNMLYECLSGGVTEWLSYLWGSVSHCWTGRVNEWVAHW